MGDPHFAKHCSQEEDIGPPPSLTCPYHLPGERKAPITSHGLWGAFRPIGQPTLSRSAIVPTLVNDTRAPQEATIGTSAKVSKNIKTKGSLKATPFITTPDLVVPHREDKALNNILGHLLRGDHDLAKTTKFNYPEIGPTPLDVSLGECCGSRSEPIIKQTPKRWIRYGKGIRALRLGGPASYRPLGLQVVPRSLSIRNVKEFLHISEIM